MAEKGNQGGEHLFPEERIRIWNCKNTIKSVRFLDFFRQF